MIFSTSERYDLMATTGKTSVRISNYKSQPLAVLELHDLKIDGEIIAERADMRYTATLAKKQLLLGETITFTANIHAPLVKGDPFMVSNPRSVSRAGPLEAEPTARQLRFAAVIAKTLDIKRPFFSTKSEANEFIQNHQEAFKAVAQKERED